MENEYTRDRFCEHCEKVFRYHANGYYLDKDKTKIEFPHFCFNCISKMMIFKKANLCSRCEKELKLRVEPPPEREEDCKSSDNHKWFYCPKCFKKKEAKEYKLYVEPFYCEECLKKKKEKAEAEEKEPHYSCERCWRMWNQN